MTQADGITPTAAEIRTQMRLLKPLQEALEGALTAATRLTDETPVVRRYKLLAELSVAHTNFFEAMIIARETLGLPYDPVIEGVSYCAMFGPED